jgi:hypothetical protein
MARAKKKAATRRRRRSPEELIADLQRQIDEVQQRKAAREMKQSPAVKNGLAAVRAIDAALELAADEQNSHLRHALADARRPLVIFFETQGLKLPKARTPRGRRPKGIAPQ